MVNHGFILVTSQRSIVVGGGVAGIAAAWRLAKAGHQVTLVESRHALGGRARSFPDPVEKGRLVDSCQHVVMGCCSSLLALLRQMGLSGLLRPQPVIHFLSHGGRRSRFEASRLPPPGHLAWALAGLHHLGVADKAGIAASIASLAVRGTGTAPTFGEWLARRGQGARVVRDFWDLVIVSALNQPSAGACPRLARKVFIENEIAPLETKCMTINEWAGEELVRFGDARLLGFVTRENATLPGSADTQPLVAVYLPMSYQIGGYTLYLPRERLEPTDLSVEAAMRIVLTGGLQQQ